MAPHWSSSYPKYLSPNQSTEEQQRVVWFRLHDHRANLAKRLSKEKEQYLAAHRELNPRTTQVESSHDPLYRDTRAGLSPNASASLHMCIVGRVLDIGGHNKSPVGPIPFISTILGVPDIYAVVEGVVEDVVDKSWRWDWGLVFFIGLLWVLIVDLGVLIVVVLFHGQCTMA